MTDDTTGQDKPPRRWNTGATLRTKAKRLENAELALTAAIVDAYREGMGVRAIGRQIGRSHRWVIRVLKAAGIYQAHVLVPVLAAVAHHVTTMAS